MQEEINKYFDIIAKNVKLFREKADMSQEMLAEKANLSREFINRIEKRKENISLKSLLTLSIIFSVKPEDFFQIK